ncbi:MAG: hypothetical protein ABI665_16110 [Vicinamibacterales bacterium]
MDIDIKVAAQADGPVLITAPPADALVIAERIAAANGDWQMDVVNCDLTKGGDIVAAITDSRRRAQTTSRKHILFLREVQTLTEFEQATLMHRVSESQPGPADPSARVFASSSVNLFEHVERGWFDERLFYYLNRVHIVLSELP